MCKQQTGVCWGYMLLHAEVFGDGEPIVFLHTGLQTGMTDFEEQRD